MALARQSKMKKKTILAATLGLVAIFIMLLSNPLRWPEKVLHAYMFNITPLGTSFDDVKETIQSHSWGPSYISREMGFLDQRTKPNKTIGSMYIRASLGDYQGIPFRANVTVLWGFDSNEKLIDLWAWKTWDGL